MTGIHRLRITAGPSESAAAMVDLSTQDVWAVADGFDLGSPDVSFDDLGYPVEASREVTLPLHISGARSLVGRVMGDIARAISVPDRWLLVQRTPSTDPVWFKIHARSPGSLDIGDAYVDARHGFWTWQLTLTVDSSAVGESRAVPQRGTDAATSTITNTGTDRGIVIDTPGEAPAPLRVDVRPHVNMNGRRVMISTFSVPWDSPLVSGGKPAIIQEDTAFSAVNGHSTRTTGNSVLSGGSALTVTLDTTSIRQVTNNGLTSWRPEPGRYLVMARLYREGGSGQADIRMGQRWLGQSSWQPWRQFRPVGVGAGNRSTWMPIGYLQHPLGDTGEGLLPSQVMPPTISVQARPTTTSPTSVLHFDQFAFVPVDLARGAGERVCFSDFEQGIGYGGDFTFRLDAESKRAAVVDGFGQYHAAPQPLRTGGWPVAIPGMATCVSVFLDTTEAPTGVDSVATNSAVRIDTSPRLLHLGQE